MRNRLSTWGLTIAMAMLATLPQTTLAATSHIAVQTKKKKPKKSKHAMMAKLAGLYQQFTRSGSPMPIFKQLSIDGAYTNFITIEGVLLITGEGRYTLVDGSDEHTFQYTEHLEFEPFGAQSIGTSNPMMMKLENNETFMITFQMANMLEPMSEVWSRVLRITPEKRQELQESASRHAKTL